MHIECLSVFGRMFFFCSTPPPMQLIGCQMFALSGLTRPLLPANSGSALYFHWVSVFLFFLVALNVTAFLHQAKKKQQKDVPVATVVSEAKSFSSCRGTTQEGNADVSKTKPNKSKKEGQRCLRKIKPAPSAEPAEGSISSPEKTCVSMKPPLRWVTVQTGPSMLFLSLSWYLFSSN